MTRYRFLSIITLLFSTLIILLSASPSESNKVSAAPIDRDGSTIKSQESSDETLANCRYGATPADDDMGQKTAVIPRLGAGWYLTFNSVPPSPPPTNDSDFAHMVHVQQNKNGFTYLDGYTVQPRLDQYFAKRISNEPGSLWIIGNEIDRGPAPGETNPDNRGQGDTFPEVYAQAYHEVYRFIKKADPTAQVAVSGLVEVTPGRLQYLDKVWNTYLQEYGQPMPVDAWTMHIYVLPEVQPDGITPNGIATVALGTNPALGRRESGGKPELCSDPGVYCVAEHDDIDVFAEQVVAMRQWMAQHGQRQKPLLLTEYSILYPFIDDGDTCFVQDEYGQCFVPSRVHNFMTKTFDYLNNKTINPNLGYSLDNNRLVQQYMWFSIYNEGLGEVSNLVEKDLVTLTPLGHAFKDQVASEAPTQNLLVEKTENVVVVAPKGGTAAAQLSVTFRNNGNSKTGQPFTVTFYEDAARTKPIASVEISTGVSGCASKPVTATAEWSGLQEGTHKYWVKIDSGNVIAEASPGDSDNVGSGTVRVVTNSNLLPVIQR